MELQDKIDAVEKLLPHGSGINDKWKIDVREHVVVCKNVYERINEAGMYDGVFPFSVRYTKHDSKVTFHSLTSQGRRIANEEDLRGYLEDTLCPLQKEISTVCNLKELNLGNYSFDTTLKTKKLSL